MWMSASDDDESWWTAHLIANDLALCVVLEVPIALESTFNDLAELDGEVFVVKEVVHTQTGARCLAGIGRTDAPLGGSDASKQSEPLVCESNDPGACSPLASQLDLLQPINDLVKVEDEVCAIGDK